MATYTLYTASLGSTYANDTVKIFDNNGVPAIVMASASGGVLSRAGIATLDGSGNLSVYLDSSLTYTVNPFPVNQPTASSSNTQESTQLLVKAAVQTIATNTAGGSATAANQVTGNTSLATIATNSATAATAAKQDTGNTSLATIATNTTGAATAANQTTGNTSLATIATNTPTVGQKTMAGSSPVVVASDQGTLPVSSPVDIFVGSTTVSVQNANPTSGVATANSTVAITLSGQNVVNGAITANTLGATITAQVTYDGSNWIGITQGILVTGAPPTYLGTSGITTGTTGQYQWNVSGAKGFRLSVNAAPTGSLTASLNASTAATPGIVPVAISQIGNVNAVLGAMNQIGGTAFSGVAVVASAPANTTDYLTVAWAAASGSGATITDTGGAVCSFDINLSTFTAGSSTGLDIFLQWSPDGGTTWYDLWQVEALTATGHAYIPPLMIPGSRRRMRWVNRTGAATTATVTVIANRHSVAPATVQRQWFDRTAGVLSGTASAVTAWYDVSGCRTIAAYIPLGVATGPASYQIQLSADQTNILPAGTAAAAVASTTTAYVATAGLTARYARLAVTTAATSQTAATAPIVIVGC